MLTHSAVALMKGLKTIFMRQFQETQTDLLKLASVVPSDSDLETYAWMDELPQVREFVASRKIAGLGDTSYTVRNKTWESTIGVRREDLDDDKIGALPARISQMAGNAKQHPKQLMIETLVAGSSSNCFDGGYFYSATHPARGDLTAAQSNIKSGSGASLTNVMADYADAKKMMRRFKDYGGKPFHAGGLAEITIVAPPELEYVFQQMRGAVDVSGTTNVLKERFELIIAPELADTNDWHLLHTGSVIKPLIFQERNPIEFYRLDNPNNDEHVFMTNEILVGTYARYNGAYGFWQDAVLISNS